MSAAPDELRAAYLRIADDLRADIAAGRLPIGSRIPSVRGLSERYGVAQGTAVQAVRQLATEGLVATSSGRGTYVKAAPAADVAADPVQALTERVARLEAQMRDLTSRLDSTADGQSAE
jgi:DNA-binding GntR family transcriptional regulator